MASRLEPVDYRGLSCYTANLARYLDAEWDAGQLLGESVRLAVRVDLPGRQLAFSHHDRPLDRLPDGGRLCYAAARTPATALAGVAAELRRYGRVLVVVDSTRLPWSPAYGEAAAAAPHWLLVDQRQGTRWRAVDEFTGLLPAGRQDPYQGWLSAAELSEAMRLPRWRVEQRRRNRLAFGLPVPVAAAPPGGAQWLRRVCDDHRRQRRLPGSWLVGDQQVLSFLARYYADPADAGDGEPVAGHLEDCWAAAGHRVFAYRWWLARGSLDQAERARVEAALERWDGLPRTLRYALESARRDRPRPQLLHRAVDDLLRAEGHATTVPEVTPPPPLRPTHTEGVHDAVPLVPADRAPVP